jgi:hypothetical protein
MLVSGVATTVVRRRFALWGLPAITVIFTAAGCQAPAQPVEPTAARLFVQTPAEHEELWQAATDVLREHYFLLDRQDRREGVITTLPETSANWFELYRPQPAPAYYWAEANLHTIQRQATVNIQPLVEPGAYEVDVEVQRYRFSLEERQVDNPAAALRLYSGAAPAAVGRRDVPEDRYWIPLGRDAPYESRLLDSILERYDWRVMEAEVPGEPQSPVAN